MTESDRAPAASKAWDYVDRELGIAVRLQAISGTDRERYDFALQQPGGETLTGTMWAHFSGWKLSPQEAVELLDGGTILGRPQSKTGNPYEAALCLREIKREPVLDSQGRAQVHPRTGRPIEQVSALLEMALPIRDRETQRLVAYLIARTPDARTRDLTVQANQSVRTEDGRQIDVELTLRQIVHLREGKEVRLANETHEMTFRLDRLVPRQDGKGFFAQVIGTGRKIAAAIQAALEPIEEKTPSLRPQVRPPARR